MNNDVLLINNAPVQDTVLVPVTAVQADLVTQTDTIVYVPLASKTAHGVVKVGEGLNVSSAGVLSLDDSKISIKEIYKNGLLITPDENKRVNLIISKDDVGLSEVNNTSDEDKPVSTPTKEYVDANFISYSHPQILTELEKAQARENIGAGTGGGSSTVEGSTIYDIDGNKIQTLYLVDTIDETTPNTLLKSSAINNLFVPRTEILKDYTKIAYTNSSYGYALSVRNERPDNVGSSIAGISFLSYPSKKQNGLSSIDISTSSVSEDKTEINQAYVRAWSSGGLLIGSEFLDQKGPLYYSCADIVTSNDKTNPNVQIKIEKGEEFPYKTVFTADSTGVKVDGNLEITGNIVQKGASYETHAEQVFSTNDYIVLRDGAISSLGDGYAGFLFKKYDGVNDGRLVVDVNGVARVGDVGDEQPLATREETPLDGGIAIWDDNTHKFISTNTINNQVSFLTAPKVNGATVALSDNVVNLTSAQNINGVKTFNNDVCLKNNEASSSDVLEIESNNNIIYLGKDDKEISRITTRIGNTDNGILLKLKNKTNEENYVEFANYGTKEWSFNPGTHNTTWLGSNTKRWKRLYLSGKAEIAGDINCISNINVSKNISVKGDSVLEGNLSDGTNTVGVSNIITNNSFTDSERKKTLNLLDFNNLTNHVINMGKVIYDYTNKTITYTNATAGDQFLNIVENLQLKPNTVYTIGVTATQPHQIYINVEGNWYDNVGGAGRSKLTFTTGSTGKIIIRLDNEGGAGSTCVFSELMLNHGSEAFPYEDYNGDIVHEKQISGFSNPNLLINGDFRVNQRGQTTYSNHNNYTVDRWNLYWGSLTVNNNGTITHNASGDGQGIKQRIENPSFLSGKTITFSVKAQADISFTLRIGIKGDWNKVAHSTYSGSDIHINTLTVTLPTLTDDDELSFFIMSPSPYVTASSMTIYWAKVEIGSVATAFSPRPYAEELAMCQRYYRKYSKVGANLFIGMGLSNHNTCYIPLTLDIPLRTTPTIKHSNCNLYGGEQGSNIDVWELTVNGDTNEHNAIVLSAGHNDYESFKKNPMLLRILNGGYIELDAEIY